MKEFLAMGGYAAYVWSAYGITVAVIALNAWLAQRRYRQALGAIKPGRGGVEPVRQPTVRKVT
jgi:heme exporter protein CcmD